MSLACILRPAGGMPTECAALGADLLRITLVICLNCVVQPVMCSYACTTAKVGWQMHV